MLKKIGNAFILLGMLLLGLAGGLFLNNKLEDHRAAANAEAVLSQLQMQLAHLQSQESQDQPVHHQEDSQDPVLTLPTRPVDTTMTEVEINGNRYIGYLTIPGLENPLPVMSDWSYPKLQIAPCRFYGSTKSDDLVVMAHNYDMHFGKLMNLTPGQEITFTDMDNVVIRYQVIATEILNPDAIDDMLSADFDLTLFTCTYGGQSRVTVRCDRILEE